MRKKKREEKLAISPPNKKGKREKEEIEQNKIL